MIFDGMREDMMTGDRMERPDWPADLARREAEFDEFTDPAPHIDEIEPYWKSVIGWFCVSVILLVVFTFMWAMVGP